LLAGAGAETADLNELFGRPVSLDALNVPRMIAAGLADKPVNSTPASTPIEGIDMSGKTDADLQELATTELEDTAYVVVQFDVSASGNVRNLEFIGSNPADDARIRRMARERINITPFRPRLENGQPIGTEDVKMVYTFEQ
jgi:hypothetical protein